VNAPRIVCTLPRTDFVPSGSVERAVKECGSMVNDIDVPSVLVD
jgi:hypothetical protein